MLSQHDEAVLDVLLNLDGRSYEMAAGVIVEFTARRTDATPQRPHGISYVLVLRSKDGGRHGYDSIIPMPWTTSGADTGPDAGHTIIGTARPRTKVAPTSSPRSISCLRISGEK